MTDNAHRSPLYARSGSRSAARWAALIADAQRSAEQAHQIVAALEQIPHTAGDVVGRELERARAAALELDAQIDDVICDTIVDGYDYDDVVGENVADDYDDDDVEPERPLVAYRKAHPENVVWAPATGWCDGAPE